MEADATIAMRGHAQCERDRLLRLPVECPRSRSILGEGRKGLHSVWQIFSKRFEISRDVPCDFDEALFHVASIAKATNRRVPTRTLLFCTIPGLSLIWLKRSLKLVWRLLLMWMAVTWRGHSAVQGRGCSSSASAKRL